MSTNFGAGGGNRTLILLRTYKVRALPLCFTGKRGAVAPLDIHSPEDGISAPVTPTAFIHTKVANPSGGLIA